jgi:putative ABC transport system permease protein
MRESATIRVAGRLRRVVGWATAAIAVIATGAALAGLSSAAAVGVAGLMAVVALALLGPVLVPVLARIVGRPLGGLGVPGHLARELAARAPRRTAATVLALGLSLALMSFMVVLGTSVKHSIASSYGEVVTADYVVESSRNEMLGGLTPTIRDDLDNLPVVATTSRVRFGHWKDHGKVSALSAVDPATLDKVADVHMATGSLRDLADGGIVLAHHLAAERHLKLGDRLPMTLAKTGNRSLRVIGFIDDNDARALSTEFIIGMRTYDKLFTERVDASVYVALAPGVVADKAKAAIEQALAPYPTADLRDQVSAAQARAGAIDQILGLVTALIAFTVLIAMLGITNTLALSIVERTRELGLLRVVGMSKAQLRRMVRAEALLVAGLAVLVGLAVGIVLGASATVTLGSSIETTVVVPYGHLAVVTALAIGAGLLSGLLPARRAARLNVLDAVAAP